MTLKLSDVMGGENYREYQVREVNEELREVTGIGVPYGEVVTIAGMFRESWEQGSVEAEDATLWWRHGEPIGTVVRAEETPDGWVPTVRISRTRQGNDAWELVKDGAVKSFSVGFEPNQYRTVEAPGELPHIIHTRAKVNEVSLVPRPAYPGAAVTSVREDNQKSTERNTPMDPEQLAAFKKTLEDGNAETRGLVEELNRRIATINPTAEAAPTLDTRSAGQYLKDLVRGDSETVAAYEAMVSTREERAYTGAVLADGINKPQWVGDLTRLVEQAAPLTEIFARGALPAQGTILEYGQLKSNTVAVGEQVAEGDNLVYGKVQVETKTAPIKTYGGWSELSRQEIERTTNINMLDLTLRAQTMAMANQLNSLVRAAYVAAAAAQTTAGNTVNTTVNAAAATYRTFISALVDAAIKFEALGLPIDALVVNAPLFKLMADLTAGDGRPVLLVNGQSGNNNVGSLNPVGLAGDIAGLTIRLDAGLATATPTGAFVNGDAVRLYADPVKRLADENIVNLTKQFSTYTYAATALEIPAAIVPLKFAV